MRPFLIALEGIDGAGTTTQAPRLAQALRRSGHPVLTTCQPSGGPIGGMVRACLRHELELPEAALALLFAADRLDHLEREVDPFGRAGEAGGEAAGRPVAICDRYLMSSWAYQGTQLPLAWVEEINRLAPPADLTVYFRVSLATAAARRAARGGPAERFDAAARQAAVATAYEQLVRGAEPPVAVVDAEAPVEAVEAQLVAMASAALSRDPRRPKEAV